MYGLIADATNNRMQRLERVNDSRDEASGMHEFGTTYSDINKVWGRRDFVDLLNKQLDTRHAACHLVASEQVELLVAVREST